MKKFEFVFEDEAPKTLSFELEGDETLSVEQHNDGAFLYANKKGCSVLARVFAKLAMGDYGAGFHLHLQQNFENSAGPDVVTIILNEE